MAKQFALYRRDVVVQQFARFIVVGVANTLVALVAIFGAKWFLGLGDVAANTIGYAIGLTVSFFLNRSWTFRHKGGIARDAVYFLGCFAVSYAVNLATVLGLIHYLDTNSYLAQALGMPPYTVVFFLLSRYVAFRSKPLGALSERIAPDR
jgi:putative flippase GtrA